MTSSKNAAQLRVYKILFLLTFLSLIGTVLYFRQQNTTLLDVDGEKLIITQEMLNEFFEVNESLKVTDQALLEKWKLQNANMDSTIGGKLTVRQAKNKMDSFRTWNTRRFNFVKEISPSGFAFGKQSIRTMLSSIDSTNRALTQRGQTDSLIYGVRAYLTFSNNTSKKDRYIDLMFSPIMKNGNNFFSLSATKAQSTVSDPGNNMLLNTSSPCPNMCGEQ